MKEEHLDEAVGLRARINRDRELLMFIRGQPYLKIHCSKNRASMTIEVGVDEKMTTMICEFLEERIARGQLALRELLEG